MGVLRIYVLVTACQYMSNFLSFTQLKTTSPWSNIIYLTNGSQTKKILDQSPNGENLKKKQLHHLSLLFQLPQVLFMGSKELLTRSSFQRQLQLPNGSAILHISSSTALIFPQQFPSSLNYLRNLSKIIK